MDAYDRIKMALWMHREERRAVVLGIEWKWPLSQYILNENGGSGFGHAVYAIGWTEEGLIIVNSAGKNAGKDGMHILPRDQVNKYVPRFGAYMFLDETPDSLRDRLINENNALQILVNFFLNIYGLLKKTAGAIFGPSKA